MTLDEARRADPHNWDDWFQVLLILLGDQGGEIALSDAERLAARRAFSTGLSPLRCAVSVTAGRMG